MSFGATIRTGLFGLVFRLSFPRWHTYIILSFELKFGAFLRVLEGIVGLGLLLCVLLQSVRVVLCALLLLCDAYGLCRVAGGWFWVVPSSVGLVLYIYY